jgi:hypothetical protein
VHRVRAKVRVRVRVRARVRARSRARARVRVRVTVRKSAISSWFVADLDGLFECRYAVMQMKCRILAQQRSGELCRKYSFA